MVRFGPPDDDVDGASAAAEARTYTRFVKAVDARRARAVYVSCVRAFVRMCGAFCGFFPQLCWLTGSLVSEHLRVHACVRRPHHTHVPRTRISTSRSDAGNRAKMRAHTHSRTHAHREEHVSLRQARIVHLRQANTQITYVCAECAPEPECVRARARRARAQTRNVRGYNGAICYMGERLRARNAACAHVCVCVCSNAAASTFCLCWMIF